MGLVIDQYRARRDSILETTRTLLAEHGYAGVTMRELATRCGVSVPTLYNRFGGKDALLAAAIEDHFRLLLGDPAAVAADGAYERVLDLLDRCAGQIVAAEGYHRRLIRAFATLDATLHVQQRVATGLTDALASALAALQADGALARWADPVAVAAQLTSACIGTAFIWSTGQVASRELLPLMRYASGLVLLGVVTGAPRTALEQRVEMAQAGLPRHTGSALQPAHHATV